MRYCIACGVEAEIEIRWITVAEQTRLVDKRVEADVGLGPEPSVRIARSIFCKPCGRDAWSITKTAGGSPQYREIPHQE